MTDTTYSDGCVGEHQGCAYAQATSPEPHLPECRAAGLGLWPSGGLCICDELRACEQRVRGEYDEYKAMLGGIEYGAEHAWDYALDAAREAVEASCDWHPRGRCVECTAAVIAIDALREEQK